MVVKQIERKAARGKSGPQSDNPSPSPARPMPPSRRRRRSPLKWNINTLMVAYVVLAATIIVALRVKNEIIVAITAVIGLVVVWGFSTIQARNSAEEDSDEEMRQYVDLVSSLNRAEQEPPPDPPPAALVESPLTERELEVLRQIAVGKSNKQVANALFISEQTVKNHLKHVYEKLNVRDRTSATLIAMQNGWIGSGICPL